VDMSDLESILLENGQDLLHALRWVDLMESAAECEGSLHTFLKRAWPSFDPSEYVDGWHIGAICEHLEAVSLGQIRRLVVNIPPRFCKTSVVSIAWPCWTWACAPRAGYPLIGPQVRFLCASYGATKAQQDAVTARRLIASPWYQERWGERVVISRDRDNNEQYDTEAGGSRISTGIPESLGKGGVIRILDDPHKTRDVESQAVLESTIRAYNEVWRTRSNDPNRGAEVIIMQRLAEGDVTGYLLDHDGDEIVHLCLPARFEADRRCVTVIGFEDPREEDGESLWPERYGDNWLRGKAEEVGRYGFAAQFQQLPAPRGGGIIQREQWKLWPPSEEAERWVDDVDGKLTYRYPPWEFVSAYLDTAMSEKDENAWCAFIRFGVFTDSAQRPKVMLASAWRDRPTLHQLALKVLDSCRRGRVDVLVIENKAGGGWVKEELQRLMRDGEFSIALDEPRGDKVARLHAVSPFFEGGLIYAPDRTWADMVITEVANFPRGKWADLTDCCSGGLGYLRRSGLIRLASEYDADELASREWRGRVESVVEGYGV
jgi:predicted phage terminase large subunit-like protein